MATYKKTSSKVKKDQNNKAEHSTTADVFNTLDETASRSEKFVIKNQKTILFSPGEKQKHTSFGPKPIF